MVLYGDTVSIIKQKQDKKMDGERNIISHGHEGKA